VTEYDPQTRIAFGYVTGLAEDEWGYISIEELTGLRWMGIPRIELDLHFEPKLLSECLP
jgi:hypothetical protein